MSMKQKLASAVRRALIHGPSTTNVVFQATDMRRKALGLTLGLAMASATFAQATVGSIFGSGLEPGSTVQIESLDTGLKRSITVDSSGRYTASSLPAGRYKVTLEKDGKVVKVEDEVGVQIGGGSEVSFAAAEALESVVVYGARPIDVSSTDTRTVFTATDLQRIPVGQSIEAVAMLAPGVIEADSRYEAEGGAASFGGSAASENAFYINGYPVTNPLTNLGSTTLPFDAIGQMQVITGGYGAEYGRATGGVVNIVTKRGTNEWTYGALTTFEPDSMRASYKNIRHPYSGTARDGTLYQKRDEKDKSEWSYGLYVGGPIVKDRLFFYASGEMREEESIGLLGYTGNDVYQDSEYEIPRWTATLDWNITDNHLLELSAVSDIVEESVDYYSVAYNPEYVRGTDKTGGYEYKDGGELYVGKYTGYLTESLTVSALYGQHKQVHRADPFGYDPSVVHVSDSRSGANPIERGTYDQLDFPDAYDETNGGRVDIEWNIGSHSLRAGYDRIDSESRAGEQTSGPGYRWIYSPCPDGGGVIQGGGGAACLPGDDDYVSRYVYANGGTFTVEQWAYYFVDEWQVTDRWLVSLGLRNENFRNFNADDIQYVEQTDQWAPRIGVTWDVMGDSSLKLYANAGRYHLAMPNNVAKRGAAGSLYTNEYFAFTGFDPVTGVPTGLTALGDGPYSSNQEYGQAPDPRTVAAKGLDSHFQDEFVLGFEKEFSDLDLIVGARYVYRDLQSAIDDVCDARPAFNWAVANGYASSGDWDNPGQAENIGLSLAHCRLFNPGESNTFVLDDGAGGFVEVPLSAEDLGFPKMKRIYQGLDMFVERPFDGLWYGRVDYTWSRNYGNAEGQLKSDVGQMDVSMTMDWDHPELMEHANGYLPNDRRHYIKAYGFMQITPELRVSATATLKSGRPQNCTGYYPDTPEKAEFNSRWAYAGPYYHFCNEQVEHRSSRGRLPWTNRLDLGVAYSPNFLGNNLVVSLDVFNVFNQQVEQNIVEYGELGGAGVPYNSTNRVISYSEPRFVRLGLRYDFKGFGN